MYEPEGASVSGRPVYGYPAVLLLASTLAACVGGIIMPVVELIRHDLGISATAVGILVAAHAGVIVVVSPFVGRATDRWGVRHLLGMGLLLYGVAGGVGTVTDSYPILLTSRVLLGAGAAAVFSVTTVALLAMGAGRDQDRMIGWRTTAMTVGAVAWPLLAGALGAFDWHATFGLYLLGIPLGIAALIWAPPEQPRRSENCERRGSTVELLRRHPTLSAWYAMTAASGLTTYGLIVFLPGRLAQAGIVNPMFVSLFQVGLFAFAGVIGAVFVHIAACVGFGVLLRIVWACRAVAFTILALSTQPLLLLAATALVGISNGLSLPVTTLLIGETPEPTRRGLAVSLAGTALFVGQGLTPVVFGPIMHAASLTTAFLVVAAGSCCILLLLARRRIADPRIAKAVAPR
ncbi:MFS transporter [Nocardia sp. NPDC057668]|uniref:MFS transporter n=1 Tax=Nocardia sp. NPDC057668 TaxID=3346202 RepID=UPI00366CC2CA